MRTQAKVIGIGQRMKGVSKKTNKPYDFQTICFACPDAYMQGVKAFTANVSGTDIDAIGGINLNQMCDIVYHTYQNNSYIDALLG